MAMSCRSRPQQLRGVVGEFSRRFSATCVEGYSPVLQIMWTGHVQNRVNSVDMQGVTKLNMIPFYFFHRNIARALHKACLCSSAWCGC